MASVDILLVDDEPALLGLLKRHLERLGYTVQAHVSAELALEAVAGSDWQPAVIIADETLPGLSGTALTVSLLERYPALKGVLCSGYPLSLDAVPTHLRHRISILQKPYMPTMLERAITDSISEKP